MRRRAGGSSARLNLRRLRAGPAQRKAGHGHSRHLFSDPETHCDIADGTWLDAAIIARLLASGADRDFVRDSNARARAQGMTGVPTFIFGHRHAVTGAQPAELWDCVIAEISAGEQTP